MPNPAEPAPAEPAAAEPAAAEPEGPLRSWWDLGTPGSITSEVTVDAIELRLVELELRHPVRTARGVHRRRPVVLVRMVGADGRGPVEGWGECAALADTTYDTEDAASALTTLEATLAPALLTRCRSDGGRLPSMAGLGPVDEAAPGSHLAFAALEMAVADAHLRSGRTSLASWLGVARSGPLVIGAVVGRYEDIGTLVARVGELVDQGYTRVKLKIGPGWDVEPVTAVRGAFGGLTVQVDANESYSEDDHRSQRALGGLDDLGLACIEQPFHRADLEAHARLAARIATPVCLDESLDSPRRVAEALAMEACSVVCVKPARLGGIGAALEVVAACARAGIPLWMGGMFESGYGRSVNAALAAMAGFAWPGDTSPAPSYLVEDLVAPPVLLRTGPTGTLALALADLPGVAPMPDPDVLDRLTTQLVRIELGQR